MSVVYEIGRVTIAACDIDFDGSNFIVYYDYGKDSKTFHNYGQAMLYAEELNKRFPVRRADVDERKC